MKQLLAWAVLAGVLLSACGTNGPLYIPEQRYPQKTPPSAPQPQKSSTNPSAP